MKKEQIAIELTKIYVEQRNMSSNPFTMDQSEIFSVYKYFLKKIEKKESK